MVPVLQRVCRIPKVVSRLQGVAMGTYTKRRLGHVQNLTTRFDRRQIEGQGGPQVQSFQLGLGSDQ